MVGPALRLFLVLDRIGCSYASFDCICLWT
uniref:Uncharacterized protein n=1 Tax=Arundo donax TaxID=35708 RepID=A0A0A9C9M8_ARUDO